MTKIDSHIEDADKTIQNSKIIQDAAKLLLEKQHWNKLDSIPKELNSLNETMDMVSKMTTKSMKGAMLAESRAKSRLAAVKKASADTVKHTANAKRAATSSKKSARKALGTFRKILKDKHNMVKYQKEYNMHIRSAIKYARVSQKETKLALKSSNTARYAARMLLEPLKI